MADDRMTISIKTKYVPQLQKLLSDIELNKPYMMPLAGKSAVDGKKAIKAFERIQAFAIREIRKLK